MLLKRNAPDFGIEACFFRRNAVFFGIEGPFPPKRIPAREISSDLPTGIHRQNQATISFAERRLDDRRLQVAVADADADLGADLGVIRADVAQADADLARGRHGAGGHVADHLAFRANNVVAVAGHTLILKLEGAEFAFYALFLLLLQGGAVDEVLALDEFRDPAQAGFDGRGRLVDVVAVEAESHLQTQRVACAEADRLDALGLASLEERLPDLESILRVEIQLEAAGAGVARVGNDDVGAACELARLEAVVGDGVEVDFRQALQHLLRLRALHSQLGHVVRRVLQFGADALVVLLAPCPVLVQIGGVDH